MDVYTLTSPKDNTDEKQVYNLQTTQSIACMLLEKETIKI